MEDSVPLWGNTLERRWSGVDIIPYSFSSVRGYAEPRNPFFGFFLDEPAFLSAYGIVDYAPRIDFNRLALLAVHRGACKSAGYAVRLAGAIVTGGRLLVGVDFSDPQPGAVTAAVITYPRALGLIDRHALVGRTVANSAIFRLSDGRTLAVVSAGRSSDFPGLPPINQVT